MRALWHQLLCLTALGLLALCLAAGRAQAHELRPGYLEITERAAGLYAVRLKVPARGGMRLKLYARLPEMCTNTKPPRTEEAGTAFIDRISVRCPGGLAGQTIEIDGLAATLTDVVARVAFREGGIQTARLTPDRPQMTIRKDPSWADTAQTYFLLGVEHILLGIDHLLFVLTLLLLVPNSRALLKTITAFTVAHSFTLAAASLGWAQAPQRPVEAMIALSIAFAAAEVLRGPRSTSSLINNAPWIAAFAFGLLHGFGFGGALKEIGLPQSDVPLALVTFNLGVETGQLLFVGAVLALQRGTNALQAIRVPQLRTVAAYGIGSVAIFWFVERLSALL